MSRARKRAEKLFFPAPNLARFAVRAADLEYALEAPKARMRAGDEFFNGPADPSPDDEVTFSLSLVAAEPGDAVDVAVSRGRIGSPYPAAVRVPVSPPGDIP